MKHATIVVAFGGNALWPRESRGEPAEQIANCAPRVRAARRSVRTGARLLLVFGNGPQVGAELLRNTRARRGRAGPPRRVRRRNAGSMGYMLELAVRAELADAGSPSR